MSPSVSKLAPTAIVLALVAWCCWPYVSGQRAERLVQEPEELPQIAASLLAPGIEPVSARDPFWAVEPGKKNSVDRGSIPGEAPAKPGAGEDPPAPERQMTDVLRGLTLDATLIHGSRQMALINGRPYAPGDSLAVSEPATNPCIVARISAHKVLIQRRGETAELNYRDPTSTTGSSGSVEMTDQAHRERKESGASASGPP